MTAHDAPRPQFPHIVLANGSIIQLITERCRRRVIRRRRPCGHAECCRWPEWWRPYRLARMWRFTAHDDDLHLLLGYCDAASLSVRGVSSMDTVEFAIPGIKVIRL